MNDTKIAKQIAHYIVWYYEQQGKPITNTRLQRLFYIVYGNYLTICDQPEDVEFQDWMLGATSPEIYFEFSSFGTDPITNTYKPDITIGLENFIISKLKGLSEYGIKDLVQEYKRPGTAWYAVHSKNNKLYQTIGNDLIRQEFLWRRNNHE